MPLISLFNEMSMGGTHPKGLPHITDACQVAICDIVGTVFKTLQFLPNLQSRPNKLECLSMASLSSLVMCNSLTFWAESQVLRDANEMGSLLVFHSYNKTQATFLKNMVSFSSF